MSQTLIAGANAALPNDAISVRILSQNAIDDGNVSFRGHDSDGFFDINLPAQPANIDKIALAFSSDQPLAQIGDVEIQVLQGNQVLLTSQLSAAGRTEKAIILAECYRRQGSWKFRFIAQGFDGGLKPLSEHFGVEIADDVPAQAQTHSSASINTQKPINTQRAVSPPPIPTVNNSAAKPSVNLSKITLTKNQSNQT